MSLHSFVITNLNGYIIHSKYYDSQYQNNIDICEEFESELHINTQIYHKHSIDTIQNITM